MNEIINLRRVRKQRARDDKARQAAEARAIHGRTKAEQRAERAEKQSRERHLDGHRLDQDPAPGPDGSRPPGRRPDRPR